MVVRKSVYCFIIATIMSLLVVLIGCREIVPGFGPAVTGSGVLETREIDFSDFESIVVGSAFEAEITMADSYLVSITMDDNLFGHLQADQHADTLHIGLEPNHTYVRTVKRVTITMPRLHELKLSGASQAEVTGFSSSDTMEFDISGASDLDTDDVTAGDTSFEISGASHVSGDIEMADGRFNLSGASTVELEGSANDVRVEASGASYARLFELSVFNVNFNLSGASRATINASGRLDGDLSGASTLNYVGNPTLGDINTSGGSTISKR